ncbi:MAG: SBBP repeat-containing protein, partial [Acidobacteria bacterium]|nr:SBBP repeat-containing protein [Acidobacteriota bacterium]
ATLSTNFRTSGDARQAAYRGAGTTGALRTGDAFLTQLNNAGSAVVYSTYLGGADDDSGWAVTVDTRSNVYVAGSTASLDFPTMSGSLQPGYGNGSGRSFPFGDAFVVRFGEPARMAVSGVASAASYAGGGVAPGEIIFFTGNGIGPQSVATLVLDANGRVSPSLAGVRVLFDGVPAPVIYVSSGQGSVIVPYSVAGKPTTQMVVEYEGNRSAALTLNVQPAKPALFSATQTGRGQGAILNQDFGYNSAQNPAAKGSYVMLYGTGEGQTNPPGVDGSVAAAAPFPRPVGAVSVKIGGLDANLIYAGAAPGQIAGLFQINAQIPEGVASGDQPVVVTIGTASSQPGLTVAVR